MIRYALRCTADHVFEAWFPGSAAFDAQSAAGQIACPSCGSIEVARALMAPAIGRAIAAKPAPPTPAATPAPPATIVAALQKIRALVEQNCDDVGTDFAPQALQMHRGTIEHRNIYGQTTAEQAEALLDEGVEIARIPWLKPADS